VIASAATWINAVVDGSLRLLFEGGWMLSVGLVGALLVWKWLDAWGKRRGPTG